jgi:FdhD protein
VTKPVRIVQRSAWRGGRLTPGERAIPEETAVAFTYGGSSYAVMMATPQDLEDFAVGFSLTEGIIAAPDEIEQLALVELPEGIELRMRLTEPHAQSFAARRRTLAGPTGCGLCGIETLTEATKVPAKIVADGVGFAAQDIMRALNGLDGLQAINAQTRAVHAAAFYLPGQGLVALREDVGRHNALDKLVGALVREGLPSGQGFTVVTSRLSIEMIQKAAAIGIPALIAASAPTALAVRMAQAAGMTLIAVARHDGFEIFTHPQRIKEERSLHVVAG